MSTKREIQNPIIPGFYPDPSICRVGDDYYIACSSFELCPGIPLFHSKDLAHWEQIGYAMTKENGLHVTANMFNGGMMAPTIRYHKGTYYIICCNFADKGNFFISAKNPEGPWSTPHWIDDVKDLDCSLFFDDDDKCYLVSPGDDPNEDNGRGIFLTPYDIEKGKVCGERKKIWNSALRGASSPEAPHLYHVGNYYYLLIAEGGTEHYHCATMARSRTIDDFYEGNPANPVLTHRHLGYSYPIDNIGHADLVQTPKGNWYAVMLGSRIIEGQHKNLGRETYLCPVIMERGWFVFAPETGKVEMAYPADPSLPFTEYEKQPESDDFDVDKLGMDWAFWGTPYEDFYNIKDSKLYLRCLDRQTARKLKGFTEPSDEPWDKDNVSIVFRRQCHIDFDASCKLEFKPKENEAAGLIIMQAANHQYRIEKAYNAGKTVLRLVMVTTVQKGLPYIPGYEAKTTQTVLSETQIPEGEILLTLKARGQDYCFYYQVDGEKEKELYLHADGKKINPEEFGGMTGTMVGMFATGNGTDSNNFAAFDIFTYVSH